MNFFPLEKVSQKKKDLPAEDKEKSFLPIGSTRRYEAYFDSGEKDLAEEINRKADLISDQASRLLLQLQADPSKRYVHSKVSGDRWNLHHLQDVKKELHDLYGCNPVHLNKYNKNKNLPKIPNNVIKFLEDFEKYEFDLENENIKEVSEKN